MMSSVISMLGRGELEVNQFEIVGRKIKNRFSIFVGRLFRASEGQMSHNQLKSRHTEWIAQFGQASDILSPDGSIGEGFESQEANQREEVVERILKRCTAESDPSRG